jgi:GT2 family glycosyltransferase
MAFWRQRLSDKRAEELMLEDSWAHDKRRRVDWAVGAALLLRREAVEAIGGFDESFFMYVEDLEWCWRATRRGWEIYFEPTALVRHLGNASGFQRYGERRSKVQMANAYTFFAREHGQIATLAYRGLNLAGSGIRYVAARLARDEQLAHYWRVQVAANLVRANKSSGRR